MSLKLAIWRLLLVVREDIFLIGDLFDRHVVKFLGVKDFAAFQALNKLCVFVSGDDSYPGVFANGRHRFAIRKSWMLFPPIVAVFFAISRPKIRRIKARLPWT